MSQNIIAMPKPTREQLLDFLKNSPNLNTVNENDAVDELLSKFFQDDDEYYVVVDGISKSTVVGIYRDVNTVSKLKKVLPFSIGGFAGIDRHKQEIDSGQTLFLVYFKEGEGVSELTATSVYTEPDLDPWERSIKGSFFAYSADEAAEKAEKEMLDWLGRIPEDFDEVTIDLQAEKEE